jgi:hypothetical protein
MTRFLFHVEQQKKHAPNPLPAGPLELTRRIERIFWRPHYYLL